MSEETCIEPDNPVDRISKTEGIERRVWTALREVEDPELPVSLVDLGVVYDVHADSGKVEVDLTLTYSGCPARDLIVDDVRRASRAVDGVEDVDVRVVYTPRWTPSRITDRGREVLREHGVTVPRREATEEHA